MRCYGVDSGDWQSRDDRKQLAVTRPALQCSQLTASVRSKIFTKDYESAAAVDELPIRFGTAFRTGKTAWHVAWL